MGARGAIPAIAGKPKPTRLPYVDSPERQCAPVLLTPSLRLASLPPGPAPDNPVGFLRELLTRAGRGFASDDQRTNKVAIKTARNKQLQPCHDHNVKCPV